LVEIEILGAGCVSSGKPGFETLQLDRENRDGSEAKGLRLDAVE